MDKERRRIGLSIRQLQGDPWSNQIKALKVGQLVEGEITRLTNFGAFAILRLPGDLEGLIHISELSEKRVEYPKEVIKVGEIVPLRIIKIDEENHRIGLSMRRVESAAYADMDWKTLAADYDLNPSTAGETLGEITGHEEALVEEPVVEAAAEPEAEAAAEPEAEAAPTEEKEAE